MSALAHVSLELQKAGLALSYGIGGLRVRGSKAAYTAELRALVDANREALVRELSAGVAGVAGVAPYAGSADIPGDISCDVSFPKAEVSKTGKTSNPGRETGSGRSVAEDEIRTLPVSLTRALPLPCTLRVLFGGAAAPSTLTTSLAGSQRARAGGYAVWEPDAFEALALAVQERRVSAADVARFDAEKRRGLWDGMRGNAQLARALMAGADGFLGLDGRVREGELAITWGELLDALGARLVEVVCEQVSGDVEREPLEQDSVQL